MSLEARLQKHWSRRSRAPVQPPPSPSSDDVDSDEEVDIRDKWNSGPSGRPIDAKRRNAELASAASSAKPPPSSDPVVQSLKDAGTAALNEGKYDEATEHYTEALAMLRHTAHASPRTRARMMLLVGQLRCRSLKLTLKQAAWTDSPDPDPASTQPAAGRCEILASLGMVRVFFVLAGHW